MRGKHTVEKIGGSSMSRFEEVMRNVLIGGRSGAGLYQRIFVVSAYGGVTNALLSDKKTGEPGVYASFAQGDPAWEERLERVRALLKDYNRRFEHLGLARQEADEFVDERVEGVRTCLQDLIRVRSFGHLYPENYLPATQELLSAVGEAHSAFNTVAILRAQGIQALFVDLSRWKETEILPLDEVILRAFRGIDLQTTLPIVTGYVKCDVGIMSSFERGYSEITFSKIAALTNAREGIIHKEYHLSTGDPVLVGLDRVEVIGNTNFDIADQMSDMNMEAIHSRAAKEMQQRNIPIRVKNAFDPLHPGTVIENGFVEPEPIVDMICGREDIVSVEVYDAEMVGQGGYDYRLMRPFAELGVSYIAKNTNANTITHYVPSKSPNLGACLERIRAEFPEARVQEAKVAIVSVLGSNLGDSGFLAIATTALASAGIEVLGMNYSTRRVNMQFIVPRDQFNDAQLALHRAFVEEWPPANSLPAGRKE
ncbi:MAG TPA: aspartate kinase [Verrucomicrobiales bacterium]|nr:aspartate kinase [Verrucomicrobiales bacterium]